MYHYGENYVGGNEKDDRFHQIKMEWRLSNGKKEESFPG
jgi:hypothetical protein